MREIKFRAWDKENKKMKQVTSWYFSLGIVHFGMGDEAFESGTNNVEIMQYTGLKDKNGKEIYEGDVVEGNFDEKVIYKRGKIVFEDGSFVLKGNKVLDAQRWVISHFQLEIIGDIYSNPELLKQS